MSLKILLTTPHLEKIIEPLYDKPCFVRNSLAGLAAVLLTNPLFEVKCIDAKFEQKSLEDLIKDIYDFRPDIIGISAYTYEIIDAAQLAATIKLRGINSLIVIGGSHVSAIPIETLKEFLHFDIGVVGEAEITLDQLCKSIEQQFGYEQIEGIVYRNQENRIILNSSREKISDLDVLPMPAWDLLPRASEYFVQTSRGCPFHCNFCFNPNGNIIRQRSVKNVMDEIEWLINNVHPNKIIFGDETFGAGKNISFNLLDQMIEKNVGKRVKWEIQTHVSFITPELLMKMKEANIAKIELGVESGNQEILRNMGKGISKEKIKNAFKLARKFKIRTGAFLIFGHPNETRKSVWESVRFVASLNPWEPIFAIMVPFPGTKIADYVSNNSMGYQKTKNDWSKYRKQINGVIKLKKFSNAKLKYYLIIANLWVFIRNFRFWGLIKFSATNINNAFNFLKNF